MSYLMGVDIGTSGTKTCIFDTSGKLISSCTAEYPLYQPQNGWAEQDPEVWWAAVQKSMKAAAAAVDAAQIAGIGLSGQMHGLVMLDAEGKVLRRAILWCDGRTSAECDEITERVGKETLLEITANPALTGFTASKILWVRKHEPDIYARCAHILLPKDYIRYKLTGVFATEVSDAGGMQLLDIKNRCWSDVVLERLEIDKSLLPRVYESPEVTGRVTEQAAALTGTAPGTAVVGGAGDNAAAAVGTGVVSAGTAFATIGTSGVVYAHTDEMVLDPKGRVHTFCCAVPGKWHVMGVTQAAGLSLKWFRDQFCAEEKQEAQRQGLDPYVLMDGEAAQSPAGSNRLLYLPYLMGERTPHLDPSARGVFFGLSAAHERKDMIRAVMEGVAYSLRDCLEILREMGIRTADMTACGGGGTSELWRGMLADLFGCPVKTITSAEGPAFGAAILAGVGAGVFSSVEEACSRVIRTEQITEPNAEQGEVYDRFYRVYTKLYPALQEQFAELEKL